MSSIRVMDLASLNPPQQQAVKTTTGPLLLLAGAGTGKTRVIIHRIARLLQLGVPPEQILSVTFTNKASREMRERVARLVESEVAGRLTIGTFHAFCCRLLRQHIGRLGYSTRFSIASSAYQVGLVRNIMAERGFAGEGFDPSAWLASISRAKSSLLDPDDLAASDHPKAADIAAVYAQYQEQLKAMDQLDFDDLLMLTHRLWEANPDLLESHRERFHYLMIDEYQDTNLLQFNLMATLARPRCNLCVVGDDDQSIYGWRGANLGNILEFERHFPGAVVIRLEQNYRSTTTILAAANAVIARNDQRREKQLWSDRGPGENITVVRAASEADESRFVCDYIQERKHRAKRPWSDCAVLFRSNHQSRALEEAFRERHIPYTLVGTNSFYQRKEILDALSLLHVLDNPRDDMSLLRVINVPPRGIGATTILKLRNAGELLHRPLFSLLRSEPLMADLASGCSTALHAFADCVDRHRKTAAGPMPLHERIDRFLRDIGYIDGLGRMYKPREDALKRLDNVLEFINAVAEYSRRNPSGDLGDFLELSALEDASDKEESSGDDRGVTLMTVHASKGLEFPVVLVVGMERGIFPHLRAIKERSEAEERRLFYVAMTRAQDHLVLSYAEKRRRLGVSARQRPSGFLDDIPDDLVRYTTPREAIAPAPPDVAADYLAQMRALFADPQA